MDNRSYQSGRRTLEQIRAAQAWDDIVAMETEKSQHCNEYGTLVRGLPAMIQGNGLAETLAFLLSKKDKAAHQALVLHLQGRINRTLGGSIDIMQRIRTMPLDAYRRMTLESIAYANWLKRYAESKGWKSSED